VTRGHVTRERSRDTRGEVTRPPPPPVRHASIAHTFSFLSFFLPLFKPYPRSFLMHSSTFFFLHFLCCSGFISRLSLSLSLSFPTQPYLIVFLSLPLPLPPPLPPSPLNSLIPPSLSPSFSLCLWSVTLNLAPSICFSSFV